MGQRHFRQSAAMLTQVATHGVQSLQHLETVSNRADPFLYLIVGGVLNTSYDAFEYVHCLVRQWLIGRQYVPRRW